MAWIREHPYLSYFVLCSLVENADNGRNASWLSPQATFKINDKNTTMLNLNILCLPDGRIRLRGATPEPTYPTSNDTARPTETLVAANTLTFEHVLTCSREQSLFPGRVSTIQPTFLTYFLPNAPIQKPSNSSSFSFSSSFSSSISPHHRTSTDQRPLQSPLRVSAISARRSSN